MHYAPPPGAMNGPDQTSDTATRNASRQSRKNRRNRGGDGDSRAGRSSRTPPQSQSQAPVPVPPSAKSSSKHQSKLKKLITKSFVKPHHALSAAPSGSMTSSEQDPLLLSGGVINVNNNNNNTSRNKTSSYKSSPNRIITNYPSPLQSLESPSFVSMDSGSVFTNTSLTGTIGSGSARHKQQPYNNRRQQQWQQQPPAQPIKNENNNNDDNNNYDDDDDERFAYETQEERQLRISQAQQDIRNQLEFTLMHCVVAMIVYISISICCFSLFLEKKWSVLTSTYFAVVTFTTIGYGDVVPDTIDARLFTCFWAISGVAALGIALGVLGSNLLEGYEKVQKKAKLKRQSRVVGLFDDYNSSSKAPPVKKKNNNLSNPVSYSTIEEGRRRFMFDDIADDSDDEGDLKRRRKECECHVPVAVMFRWVLLSFFFTGTLYAIARSEDWDLITTVYYTIITASTVGYGDFSPKSEMGRTLAIVFIPIAVSVMGFLLGSLANAIISYRQKRYTRHLENKPLTQEDIDILDENGDGQVTRAEFLQFMLVAMNQVDKSLLDSLNEHFDRLDADKSGVLDKDDLALMAKQHVATNNRNALAGSFRLANYRDYKQKQ